MISATLRDVPMFLSCSVRLFGVLSGNVRRRRQEAATALCSLCEVQEGTAEELVSTVLYPVA